MNGKSIAVVLLSQIASNGGWLWYNMGCPDAPLFAVPILAGVGVIWICVAEIYKDWGD